MKVGLDVWGGDFAPESTIKGAIKAREILDSDDQIVLIGDKGIISDLLKQYGSNPGTFEIVHTSEVIKMGDQPIKSYTQKPNSSIVVGSKLLKSKQIDAFAGAGNSGAMLVSAIYSVSTIPGVIRPCTVTVIPKEKGGHTIMLDIGTVPDAKPDVMYQFAILGSLYAQYVFNIENPKVALLNIGEEEEKGNLLTQAVHQLMKGAKEFNFVGNAEGRDFFNDRADVIVSDGFTGNVVLKQIEAMYRMLTKRKLVDSYIERFNYENYGGSPILGINSTVVIGHGISNDNAIKNMIMLARDVYQSKLSERIREAFMTFSQNNIA